MSENPGGMDFAGTTIRCSTAGFWCAALAIVACALIALVPSTAVAAPHFSDGVADTSVKNINCPSLIMGSPYLETEVGFWVGQYLDDESSPMSPVVGEVFDLRLVVATIGNDCAGTAPQIEIALPPGVTPAVGGAFTIRCFTSTEIGNDAAWQSLPSSAGCPTTIGPGFTNHPSISTWYGLNPNPATYGDPLWKIGQGAAVQIHVPVVASRLMNGIGDTSGCSCVVASVKTINGHAMPVPQFTWASSSPTGTAYQPLFVFPGKLSGSDPQPGGVKLKRSGKPKILGRSVKFGVLAYFDVPTGMNATQVCTGKLSASIKPRGLRRAARSRGSLRAKGTRCEAKLTFKLPKKFKRKSVKIALSFAGNAQIAGFKSKLNYRIK